MKDDHLQTEQKFMVFLLQLMLLFQFCPLCQSANPLVETSVCGTKVIVHTHWQSQLQAERICLA